MLDKIKDIEERRKQLRQGGGAAAIEKLHKATKLTARERIDLLVDKGTFNEDNLWVRSAREEGGKELPADAVVTGVGRIHNLPVCVYAHDFTVLGGSFGRGLHYKVGRMMERARDSGLPLIGLVDSAGERQGESWTATGPIGEKNPGPLYMLPIHCSGVVPTITVMLGPSFAGSAYSPTMASDFYIMRNKTAHMAVASPQLLKAVTFTDVTQEEIGGATLHATVTGNADWLTETDAEAIEICRELLTYLPPNYRESPPVVDTGDDINRRDDRLIEIVPDDLSQPYDMREVIRCIVDNGQFVETGKLFAGSLTVGLGRLNGRTVGIVANNPSENGGVLTINTSDKAARFIRFCDCFNIPLIFLVDTPGFSYGTKDFYGTIEEQSRDGLLRTAPKVTFAICEATVPKIVVHIGKCFGPTSLFMGNTSTGADFVYAWPGAKVARVKPEEAVEDIYKEEISSAQNPDDVRKKKLAEVLEKYYNSPYQAAGEMMVNELIDPRDTRPVLIRALENLAYKKPTPRHWRKHSLIPR